jgi:hypothetical protein
MLRECIKCKNKKIRVFRSKIGRRKTYLNEKGRLWRSPNICYDCGFKSAIKKSNCRECSSDMYKKSTARFCSVKCKKRHARPKIKKLIKFKCIFFPGEYFCKNCNSSMLLVSKNSKKIFCNYKCKKRYYRKCKPKSNYSAIRVGAHCPSKYLKKRNVKLNRVPNWQNKSLLVEFYKNCPKGYVVDHIIPLNSNLVSGLHCTDNMQYLLAEDNNKKSNSFDGTYANLKWAK